MAAIERDKVAKASARRVLAVGASQQKICSRLSLVLEQWGHRVH
jgi:hypothetical protein